MKSAWKQAFTTKEELEATKKQWIKALVENNVSDGDLIEDALASCRATGGPFMPSTDQFIAHYRRAAQERIGAMETMDAYRHLLGYYAKPSQLREPCELNPLVYHLICHEDWDAHNFRQMRNEEAVKYFSARYADRVKAVIAGEPVQQPIQRTHRIDKPAPGPESQQRAEEALANLKSIFGHKNQQ